MENFLANQIQRHFIERRWTLSLAESCTGGQVAAQLTRFPGCSQYFLGSIVAYSEHLKTSVLGVKPESLMQYGAVSGPVVSQMAQGVLSLTGSTYSLAVSGIAGPDGGSPLKPVGTIWAAIATKQEELFVWEFNLAGNRHAIILKTVHLLLDQLWTLVKTDKSSI